MTTVLCAYTELHPMAARALGLHAPTAEMVDVSCDDRAYCAAIARRWGRDGDLVLVEHDIEIHGDVLRQFSVCDGPWCVFPYELSPGDWLDRGLGCVRFSLALQRRVPVSSLVSSSVPEPGSWRHLDGQIAEALERYGFDRHVHEPPVTHWNRALRRPAAAGGVA